MLEVLGELFVEPTIIKMPADAEILGVETFAPILYIIEFDTLDDAIAIQVAEGLALVGDVPQGLPSFGLPDVGLADVVDQIAASIEALERANLILAREQRMHETDHPGGSAQAHC